MHIWKKSLELQTQFLVDIKLLHDLLKYEMIIKNLKRLYRFMEQEYILLHQKNNVSEFT